MPESSEAPIEPVPLSIYDMPVETLTPEECGRCHPYYYNLIRAQGGKHRIDCQECHVEFHVYRPGKDEYDDIMPKCGDCHEQVHGPDLPECLGCHTEPHAPLVIPANRPLEDGCYICHAEVDKEMKTYITQHTEFYCHTCHHNQHRYVPECLECHQPHSETDREPQCLPCHPAHKVFQVAYPEDIPGESCADCHPRAYEMLKASGTKHAELGCARCHPGHKAIVRCKECHPEAHNAEILQAYPVCGRCHGVAHALLQ